MPQLSAGSATAGSARSTDSNDADLNDADSNDAASTSDAIPSKSLVPNSSVLDPSADDLSVQTANEAEQAFVDHLICVRLIWRKLVGISQAFLFAVVVWYVAAFTGDRLSFETVGPVDVVAETVAAANLAAFNLDISLSDHLVTSARRLFVAVLIGVMSGVYSRRWLSQKNSDVLVPNLQLCGRDIGSVAGTISLFCGAAMVLPLLRADAGEKSLIAVLCAVGFAYSCAHLGSTAHVEFSDLGASRVETLVELVSTLLLLTQLCLEATFSDFGLGAFLLVTTTAPVAFFGGLMLTLAVLLIAQLVSTVLVLMLIRPSR